MDPTLGTVEFPCRLPALLFARGLLDQLSWWNCKVTEISENVTKAHTWKQDLHILLPSPEIHTHTPTLMGELFLEKAQKFS